MSWRLSIGALIALVVAQAATPPPGHSQGAPQDVVMVHGQVAAFERPVRQAVSIPDSVRKKVGYQHWRGAAIGVAAGAVGALLLAAIVPSRCADCGLEPNNFKVGLVGAGLGGAFGFLVGAASPKYSWVPSDSTTTDPQTTTKSSPGGRRLGTGSR